MSKQSKSSAVANKPVYFNTPQRLTQLIGANIYHQKWQGGKGKGSIITADGMLYCFDERRGMMGLVRPGQSFDVVSEFKIQKGSGPYWAHPTIADGILYVRHGEAMYAYKLK